MSKPRELVVTPHARREAWTRATLVTLRDLEDALAYPRRAGGGTVARSTLDTWRRRHVLPDPDQHVGISPAWHWGTVLDWLDGKVTDRARS